MERERGAFDRCNLHRLALERVRAHGGEGLIGFHRIATGDAIAGACRFIDFAELPPGTAIGRHRHGDDEEEFYLVLDGAGRLVRDGEESDVRAGDLVRNRPGGEHALRNNGPVPLRLFVFALPVEAARR